MNQRDRHEITSFTCAAPTRVRVGRRRSAVRWTKRIVWGLSLAVLCGLLMAPWQQNVAGSGRVVAFAPTDRMQVIEAPVKGRIIKWHVQEGSAVEAGAPIVDISDNDPQLVQRLARERDAVRQRVEAARGAVTMSEMTIVSLEAARDSAVTSAELYVLIAEDKKTQADEDLRVASAAHKAATLNHTRQNDLGDEGLSSTRKVEVADMKLETTRGKASAAKAKQRAAKRHISAAAAKLDNIRNKERALIGKARQTLEKQRGELAKAKADLAKMDVKVARQESMRITAPVAGTVLRLKANGAGEVVKAGDVVAELVPDTTSRAVELWVTGNDMPLVTPGRKVRVQFEGWPAVQFVGWPAVAVGTFGGVVSFVDATDDGKGYFRVVVTPDPDDEPWPETRFLRQGVRANGWLLLDRVTVAFELWRQLNGFPPTVARPGDATTSSKGKSKEDKGK